MLTVTVEVRGGCCQNVEVTDELGQPVPFDLDLIDYDDIESRDEEVEKVEVKDNHE